MKTFLYLTLTAFIGFSFIAPVETNILNLQKTNKVKLEVFGNSNSTHYLKPLVMTITNNTSKKLDVVIPAGLHFASREEGYQDIISTQEEIFVLAPHKSKKVEVSGMCIQHYNSGPSAETAYILKGNAKEKLYQLAQFLDQKNIQNSQGQQAMWVLSDGNDPYSIIGLDSLHQRAMLDLTLQLAGKDKISNAEYKLRKEGVQNPQYTSKLRGNFKMNFRTARPVQIALFNEENVLIKEIYNGQVEAGETKVEFAFDSSEYRGKTIITQLIAGDKVWSRREIKLPG